jgi:hypothetical protein
MNPELIVPIVAILMVFGSPVAIVYVLRHFRLKERELQFEAAEDTDERYKRLEGRLERMEKLLGSMQSEIRALPPHAPKGEHLYLPAPGRDEPKG